MFTNASFSGQHDLIYHKCLHAWHFRTNLNICIYLFQLGYSSFLLTTHTCNSIIIFFFNLYQNKWTQRHSKHKVKYFSQNPCTCFFGHQNIFSKNVVAIYLYNTTILSKSKSERARTTNGEVDLVADENYEIWNCTIFVIWIFRGKSKLYICIYHAFSLNNQFA